MSETFAAWLEHEGIASCESVCSAAIDLAVRGVRVFPLRGKLPATAHGVNDATDEIAQVVRWFRREPTLNVGIAIGVGALTGVRVLDSDPRNGGGVALDELVAKHGSLPASLTIETGRRDGGLHRYYSVPSGTYRTKIGAGLDWLGVGKYAVAAPSIHPETGHAYRVVSPPEVGISPAPAWLVQLSLVQERSTVLTSRRRVVSTPTVERARRYLVKCDPAISGSGGHTATFLVAQRLVRGFALDVDTAFALLANEYNPRCKPPWSDHDLRRKVVQAAEHGRMDHGAMTGMRVTL